MKIKLKQHLLLTLFFVFILFSKAIFSEDSYYGDDGDYYYDYDTGDFSSPEPQYDSTGRYRTYELDEYDGGYPYGPNESYDTNSRDHDFIPLPPKINK